MEQGLAAKGVELAEAWAKVRAEAGWVVRLPQGLVEIAYAPVAAIQSHILSDNPVIKKPALSVKRE